jgi:hypothetical protein
MEFDIKQISSWIIGIGGLLGILAWTLLYYRKEKSDDSNESSL